MRYALDNLVGAGDEVILCHIIALSPNALTFADARAKTVRPSLGHGHEVSRVNELLLGCAGITAVMHLSV